MDVALTDAELERVTGCKQRAAQMEWLRRHRWVYTINHRQEIIVGRFYADRRLAGLQPGATDLAGPNLEAVS